MAYRKKQSDEDELLIPEFITTPDGVMWPTAELLDQVTNYRTFRRNASGHMQSSTRIFAKDPVERQRLTYDRMIRDRNLSIAELRDTYTTQTDNQRYALKHYARRRFDTDPVLQEYARTGVLPTD
tara:strand:+ start:1726 stop:2100 length:375 start_codon:yes stop_codon:yes gene_type:complete